MNKWEDLSYSERCDVAEWFTTWLQPYTKNVVNRVVCRIDEILGDDLAMGLIKELHEREAKERDDFKRHFSHLAEDFKGFAKYSPHNHAVTHSNSYRDILYDMYIRR